MGWTIAAQERGWEWGWGMHHPMWWVGGAWGIGMMLTMLVFWGFLIAGVVLVVRWLAGQGGFVASRRRDNPALEILRERYARGEIERDEFEAKKRDLG